MRTHSWHQVLPPAHLTPILLPPILCHTPSTRNYPPGTTSWSLFLKTALSILSTPNPHLPLLQTKVEPGHRRRPPAPPVPPPQRPASYDLLCDGRRYTPCHRGHPLGHQLLLSPPSRRLSRPPSSGLPRHTPSSAILLPTAPSTPELALIPATLPPSRPLLSAFL